MKFTGHERDFGDPTHTTDDLDYMHARHYNPVLGRFLAVDPVRGKPSLAQSWNSYSYTDNRPLALIDPTGREENSPENLKVRTKIATTAASHNNSQDWAYDRAKDDHPANSNKCSKFVNDVTEAAGAKAVVKVRTAADTQIERGPTAAEWANRTTAIPNWRVLKAGESTLPGDVAAYRLSGGGVGATGHAGIITFGTGDNEISNISAHADAVYTVPGQFLQVPRTVYTGD